MEVLLPRQDISEVLAVFTEQYANDTKIALH